MKIEISDDLKTRLESTIPFLFSCLLFVVLFVVGLVLNYFLPLRLLSEAGLDKEATGFDAFLYYTVYLIETMGAGIGFALIVAISFGLISLIVRSLKYLKNNIKIKK